MTNWVVATFVWTVAIVTLISLATLLLQQPLLQPTLAFGRGMMTYLADAIHVLATTARSLITQPAARLILVGLAAIALTWLGVMIKVLTPNRNLA